MFSDPNTIYGFFDELEAIEKQAFLGALGKGLKVIGGRALQGAKAVGAGLKGATGVGMKGVKVAPGAAKQLISGGLREMAPAAAIGAGGLLAGYGAKKAVFG